MWLSELVCRLSMRSGVAFGVAALIGCDLWYVHGVKGVTPGVIGVMGHGTFFKVVASVPASLRGGLCGGVIPRLCHLWPRKATSDMQIYHYIFYQPNFKSRFFGK